jgi:hypothetical protein
MGPSDSLDSGEDRNLLPQPAIQHRFFGHLACRLDMIPMLKAKYIVHKKKMKYQEHPEL